MRSWANMARTFPHQFNSKRIARHSLAGAEIWPARLRSIQAIRSRADMGTVLDPIGSLRTAVRLEPGETRELAFVLGAAQCRSDVDEALAEFECWPQIAALFTEAAAVDATNGEPRLVAERSHTSATGEMIMFHPPHRDGHGPAVTNQARYRPSSRGANGHATAVSASPPLEFENGYGGFSADGREYVLRIRPDEAGDLRLPPRPWCNVIANEQAGFLVTESGAGYTWVGQQPAESADGLAQRSRFATRTPKRFGFATRTNRCFGRRRRGRRPRRAEYEVRHGFGYTKFRARQP